MKLYKVHNLKHKMGVFFVIQWGEIVLTILIGIKLGYIGVYWNMY